jgi:hypothetical protein
MLLCEAARDDGGAPPPPPPLTIQSAGTLRWLHPRIPLHVQTTNQVQEFEAATLEARPDAALHAVRLEIADPNGKGVCCLIGPGQARDLILRLVSALGALVPG